MERYKRNRWHRSKAEEIVTALLGFVILASSTVIVLCIAQ